MLTKQVKMIGLNGISMKPDAWIVVKIKGDEIIHKIVAGWSGSYLYGNSWKINSGIKSVTYSDGIYSFLGFSGSVYECRENSYGLQVCNAIGYNILKVECQNHGVDLEILDEDTDWVNYKF